MEASFSPAPQGGCKEIAPPALWGWEASEISEDSDRSEWSEWSEGVGSIGDHGFEGGCLLNHGGQFFLGGDAAAEVALGVDFHQTCVEIVGTAVTEFLNGIHAGSLEKFGELRTYAFDAEEIGVVGPTENEFGRDSRFESQCLAALGCLAALEELFNGVYSGSAKLGGV